MGKALDLKNQKFGRLTVLYKTEKRKNGSIVWHCKCDCGNECDVSAGNLTRSNKPTLSCGCLHIESASRQGKQSALDLAGQRFGKLIALEPTEQRNGSFIVWKCKCDCGNICYVTSSNLKRNLTRSCGCLKSQGELKITTILTQSNIPFVKEKTFEKFVTNTNTHYRFDFFINNEYIIEFDGQQHLDPHCFGGILENFKDRVQKDQIKNQFCLEHNIPLYRIPYYDLNKIESLKDILQDKYLVKQINHYNIQLE